MALTLGLRLLLELPGMPYNVVELFAAQSLLNVGLFSVALLWLGVGPWGLSRWAGSLPRGWLWLPTLLPLAALFSLLLLRLSVTQESLDDITGSTDLYRRVTMENYWGEAWRETMAWLPVTLVDVLGAWCSLHGALLPAPGSPDDGRRLHRQDMVAAAHAPGPRVAESGLVAGRAGGDRWSNHRQPDGTDRARRIDLARSIDGTFRAACFLGFETHFRASSIDARHSHSGHAAAE